MAANIRMSSSEPEITAIAELTPNSRSIAIRFKVLTLTEPRKVMSRKTSSMYLVQEASIADTSAKINMTLWNDDVETLEIGQTYLLTRGYIREYDECMHLVRGRDGEYKLDSEHLEKTNEAIDMSKPFAGRTPFRRNARTKSGRSFRGTSGREEKGYCSWKGF